MKDESITAYGRLNNCSPIDNIAQ